MEDFKFENLPNCIFISANEKVLLVLGVHACRTKL